MFVTSCPHCGDAVTVPLRARLSSRLRCPLCSEEYALSDLLAKLPPALEIVGEEALSGDHSFAMYAAEGGEGDVATMVAGGEDFDPAAEMALASAEPRAARPSYSFDGESGGTRTAVKAAPRPKKKGGNPVLGVIGVMGGGLMAIPLAIVILWWAFGNDSLDLGPKVAKYAPWIVPASLHGNPTADKPSADAGGEPRKPVQPNGELPPLPDPVVHEPNPQQKSLDAMEDEPLDTNPLDPQPLDEPDLGLEPDLKIDNVLPGFNSDPKPPPKVEPQPADEKAGVRNAPTYPAAELITATENANSALQAWKDKDSAEAAEVPKLARQLYQSLATLGEKVTFVDVGDAEAAPHVAGPVKELIASLPAEAGAITVLNAGAGWSALDRATRGTDGIVLYGKVKSIAPQGQLFETRLVLEDAKQTEVAVLSVKDPADSYQPDSRLIVLGVIVNEPAKSLAGYAGSESRVVFGGYPAVLPAE